MAEQNVSNQNNNEVDMGKLIKGLLESSPYLKGAYKKAQEQGATDFEQAAQTEGGKAANDQLLKQITELAQTPMPTGERMGLGTSLIKGHGTERPQHTKPLGGSGAIQLQKLMTEQQKLPREQAQENINIIKGLLGIQAATPEGQQQAEIQKARGQARAQEEKARALSERNVRIANNKLSITMKKFDEMVAETQRLTGVQAGRKGGILTTFLGATGKNPKVAPFKGQLVETSIALAKIAAPSAKVGPAFAKLMRETLPTTFANMEEARGQIITSMTNAFANYAAANPDEFPEFNVDVFEEQATRMVDTLVNRERELKSKTPVADKLQEKVKTIGRFKVEVK